MEGTTDANDTVDPQMTSHPNPETLQPEVDKTTHQEQPDIVMQDVEIRKSVVCNQCCSTPYRRGGVKLKRFHFRNWNLFVLTPPPSTP